MSEKWEATLDGFIYSQPSGAPDDGGDLVASGLDARTAQQIVREHNAHAALVEALRDALHALAPGTYDSREAIEHNRKAAAVKARAALKLAEDAS